MVQSFVLFWTVFEQFSGQEYMVLHPVTSDLFTVSNERVVVTESVGKVLIAPPMNPPVPQEAGPRVVICQVSPAGRWEVFLNLSEVRRPLDARVLERRGDLSARLIKHRWSGALLGDSWTLEISVPLSDNEGNLILSLLTLSDGPGSPQWDCGDDEAPEFVWGVLGRSSSQRGFSNNSNNNMHVPLSNRWMKAVGRFVLFLTHVKGKEREMNDRVCQGYKNKDMVVKS